MDQLVPAAQAWGVSCWRLSGLGYTRYFARLFTCDILDGEGGAMAGSISSASSGRIFISYRREETAYPAGWLYDRLTGHFGDGQVFKDGNSIQLGDDFIEVITRAVGSGRVQDPV